MISHDKKLHFAVGAAIVLAGFALGHADMGFVLAIAAGLVRAIYDLVQPLTRKLDLLNFVATVSGGAAAYLIVLFIQKVVLL